MKIVKEHEVKGDYVAPPYERIIKHLAAPWTMGTKNIALGLSKIKVGSKTNAHSHDVEEEVFYIISGRGKIIVGGEESDVEPGSCIYIPRNTVHQVVNTHDETLNLLWSMSPPLEVGKFRRIHKLSER